MANEENKKIDMLTEANEELEEIVSKEEPVEESLKGVPEAPVEVEETGKAFFQETKHSKLPFIAVIVVVVLVAGALFFKGFSPAKNLGYVNQIHGYSYEYPQEMQLVAEGNIPAELASQGVTSMEQLNLTQGDSLLVNTNEETGDNIVYTVLELSTRPNYVDFESYTETLFASLNESKEVTGTDYLIGESTVGEGIPSTEYSFEMEVPINDSGDTRTGVFYDNVFQTADGKAYSISFGYPKDVENADKYVTVYRKILASFKTDDASANSAVDVSETSDENVDEEPVGSEEAPIEETVETEGIGEIIDVQVVE